VKKHHIFIYLFLLAAWLLFYTHYGSCEECGTALIFGMQPQTHLMKSIAFFIYEVPKVLILLVLVVLIVGIIRTFFSPEKTRQALEGKPLFASNVLASVLGIVTPFCSCSAIPLFLGFVEAGIPIGVTFSFLIAAPMINEVALVLLAGLFGWKIAAIYVGTGLTIAILSGYIIEKLHLQRYVAEWVFDMQINKNAETEEKINWQDRLSAGHNTVKEIVGKIWLYVLIGIAVGAGAHGYVPDDYLASVLGEGAWYAVPLAVILGVPMYANAAGIIPIISVLIEKGVALGTALAFMMSVIALSLPEIIILKKVLKWQLIAIFVSIVAIGILLVGFLFNTMNI